MTERLARACARHPWRTVGGWILTILLAVVAVGALLGGALTTEGSVTNNPESEQAYTLEAERFPQRDFTTELVIVRSERLTFDDPAFQANLRTSRPSGRRRVRSRGRGTPSRMPRSSRRTATPR